MEQDWISYNNELLLATLRCLESQPIGTSFVVTTNNDWGYQAGWPVCRYEGAIGWLDLESEPVVCNTGSGPHEQGLYVFGPTSVSAPVTRSSYSVQDDYNQVLRD